MREHFIFHEQFIADGQDLCQRVEWDAIVGNVAFATQVIKTDGTRLPMEVIGPDSIPVDHSVTFLAKLQCYPQRGSDDELPGWDTTSAEDFHDSAFAAADGSSQ